MRGEPIDTAELGWHGIEGDRRLAFRRLDREGGFPWLTGTRLADLIMFSAVRQGDKSSSDVPTHVRTPDGRELGVFGDELATEIASRYGGPVQMMQLRQGIFDDGSISVISTATVEEISRMAGQEADARRFRPNIVLCPVKSAPFQEDGWLGGTLRFGAGEDAAAVSITVRDKRCAMINLDPDSAASTPEVLKAVVRANDNNAGVYATVIRPGRLVVGQPVYFKA